MTSTPRNSAPHSANIAFAGSPGRRANCTSGAEFDNIDNAMKVFVSGQINEVATIREAYRLLAEAGFTITHDWTLTDLIVDKVAQRDEAGKRAYLDISGVVDADVYILMSGNQNPGKGMYVELGAALALQQTTGSPEVFVVGPLNHMSIFYLHPDVKHRTNIADVIRELILEADPTHQPPGTPDRFGSSLVDSHQALSEGQSAHHRLA